MSPINTTSRIATLGERVRQIQSQWSPAERRRRAENGLRRSRELIALLLDVGQMNVGVDAVGAVTCEDWRRLAG